MGFCGVWHDYGLYAYIAEGVDVVSTMVNSIDPNRPNYYDVKKLKSINRLCRENGAKHGVTIWPHPSVPSHKQVDVLKWYNDAVGGLHHICLDIEGQWTKHSQGVFNAKSWKFGDIPLWITSYPYHQLAWQFAAQPEVDAVIPQVYSRFDPRNPKYSWDGEYGPRRMQRLGRGLVAPTGKPIIWGLAAYRQQFPSHTMQENANTIASEIGLDADVMLWSTKHWHHGFGTVAIDTWGY